MIQLRRLAFLTTALSIAVATFGTALAGTFDEFRIDEVRLTPVSPGVFDVEVDILVNPDNLSPWGSLQLRLSGSGIGSPIDVFLDGPGIPGPCCNGPAECPPADGFTSDCTGTCAGGPQLYECVYHQTKQIQNQPLISGGTLVAALDPNGDHAESSPHTPSDNSFSTIVPASIPTLSEWGLIILTLLTLAGVAITVARKRRAIAA